MDPVSHLSFGRVLIALDSDHRLGRGATAACLAGSLSPDLDAVLMPVGWDVYLLHHQGGTHSLIGSVVCAILVAALASAIVKGSTFRNLALAAWAGACGHLLLDLVSGADLRPLWPLGPRIAVPLFAMADPWLAAILVLAVVALLLKFNPRRVAALALLCVAIVATGKAALYAKARVINGRAAVGVVSTRADVEWGSLTRWIVYEARTGTVHARRIDALTGVITPLLDAPRGLESEWVVRSRQFASVQNFLAGHDVTFAVVNPEGREILWSDLRYCGPVELRSAAWAAAISIAGSPIACGLWVGGEFDPLRGTLGRTIVHIGHIVQRRGSS
jgi:membrane-bound metal-dependent hydrolase YbcI (DUF457 family)